MLGRYAPGTRRASGPVRVIADGNEMNPQDRSSLLRNFPPDLLVLSGLPFLAIALFSSWFFGLRGTEWIVAFLTAFLTSLVGATLIFRAKRPLYRKGIYFSIGSRALPEESRRVYARGLLLSVIGITFSIFLIAASFLWR